MDPARKQMKGLQTHNFQWTRRSEVVGATAGTSTEADDRNDQSVILDVEDVLTDHLQSFPGAGGSIKSRGVIQYVVLQRIDRKNSSWMIPTKQQFHDFVNNLEYDIMTRDKGLMTVMKWSNVWDDVGLIGLSTREMDRLRAFCACLRDKKLNGMLFTVVPKDLVSLGSTVITLLKSNHRGYNLEILPAALFQRNLYLDGELVVTKSRLFGAGPHAQRRIKRRLAPRRTSGGRGIHEGLSLIHI